MSHKVLFIPFEMLHFSVCHRNLPDLLHAHIYDALKARENPNRQKDELLAVKSDVVRVLDFKEDILLEEG